MTWERNVNDWNLQQSTLIIFDTPEPAPFGTATLAPVEGPPAEEEENVLYFDAGGLVPTTRFQLEFSKSNRWVNASVFRSDSIDGPWQWLSGHLFYQVEYEGVQFNNSAVDVRGPRRYWKFELDGPVDQQDVGLRLDYLEDSIRVAANGTAPYMLVGGTLLEEAGPDTTFANVWQRLDATELVLETAGVGQRRQLGGAAALLPPTTIPWQTVVLWGSLFAGVLLVAWMAVRLGREAFSGSSSDQ